MKLGKSGATWILEFDVLLLLKHLKSGTMKAMGDMEGLGSIRVHYYC